MPYWFMGDGSLMLGPTREAIGNAAEVPDIKRRIEVALERCS